MTSLHAGAPTACKELDVRALTGHSALKPLSCVLQAIRDTALTLEQEGDAVLVRAAVPLAGGMQLTHALVASATDLETRLATLPVDLSTPAFCDGAPGSGGALPSSGQHNSGPVAPQRAAFELCLSPPEGDEHFAEKLRLLEACGVGTAHALRAAPPEAAVARAVVCMMLCLADGRLLRSGCLRTCTAAHAAAAAGQAGATEGDAESNVSTGSASERGTVANGFESAAAAAQAQRWDDLFAAQAAVLAQLPDASRSAHKAAVKQLLEVVEGQRRSLADARKAVGSAGSPLCGELRTAVSAYVDQLLAGMSDWRTALKDVKNRVAAAGKAGAPLAPGTGAPNSKRQKC